MSDKHIFQNEESRSSTSSIDYSNKKLKEIVSHFISSLFEKEKEEQDKKIVINFIDSLFETEQPKINTKKVNNISIKKKVEKNFLSGNKKIRNNDRNNIRIKKNKQNIKNDSQDKTIDTNMYRNNLIKKILNINRHKNEYERNKSIELRPKNININDEYNIIKINKNNSAKKRIIKKSDNNNSIEKKSITLDISNDEESGKKYKAKLESEKERKKCEEKIRLLKNHISAMKRQQENMNKKMLLLKNKENLINSAKRQKEKNKRDIYEYKIIKRAELEQKRKNIEKQKENFYKGMKESMNKTILDKQNKYKLIQKEIQEMNKQKEKNNANKIIEHIQKIKSIREINKNLGINRRKILNQNYNNINEKKYENNIEKTKLLKEEIKQLLDEEDECLENLNKTKTQLDIMTSSDKYSSASYKAIKTEHKPLTDAFYLDKE